MKVAVVLGTRPEIIKFSPIIRELEKQKIDYFILHSGQHYSYSLDKVFFDQLGLPDAKYNLDVGSGSHGQQTAKILAGVEAVLQREMPDIVLVQGDTNTVLAGALAASKLNIKIGHVEAGLRSFDRKMPEEINRVLADHCSDFLFAPTNTSKDLLLKEGISKEKVHVVGNTIVDAVIQNLELSKQKTNTLKELGLDEKTYFLATVHRQENVDDKERFKGIIKGLSKVSDEFNLPVLYPIHPRAEKQLKYFDLTTENLKVISPLDYLSFIQLESSAKILFTDSGGVQEEACILGVPCVTLRDNTERPETLEIGSNILAGTYPEKIVESSKIMFEKNNGWRNPFGNGSTGAEIVKILKMHN